MQQGMHAMVIKQHGAIIGILRTLIHLWKTPHTGICGINQGEILNLTAEEASATQKTEF